VRGEREGEEGRDGGGEERAAGEGEVHGEGLLRCGETLTASV
jgi:hypothetical protein